MDPTILAARIPEPMQDPEPWSDEVLPKSYDVTGSSNFTPQLSISLTTNSHSPARYVNLDRYNLLQDLKSRYKYISPKDFSLLVDLTNPYNEDTYKVQLNNTNAMTRAVLKLANIDAVYHVTNHVTGLMKKQVNNPSFKYAVLADGPGGFVQYIQYRNAAAVGWGITLKDSAKASGSDWNLNILKNGTFNVYNRNNGNIIAEWKNFAREVRLGTQVGADLCTADGGFEITGDENLLNQEFLSSNLILSEVASGLMLLRGSDGSNDDQPNIKPTDSNEDKATEILIKAEERKYEYGGNYVLKIFGCVTRITAEMIFVLTQCFDRVSIFKPVSSKPANSELYCVCMHRRSDAIVQPWIDMLEEVMNSYNDTSIVESFLKDLPQDYENWLTTENNRYIESQITVAYRINTQARKLRQGETPDSTIPPKMSVFQCLLFWNMNDAIDSDMDAVSSDYGEQEEIEQEEIQEESQTVRVGRGKSTTTPQRGKTTILERSKQPQKTPHQPPEMITQYTYRVMSGGSPTPSYGGRGMRYK